MAEFKNDGNENSKKRVRDESEDSTVDSPELKLARVESVLSDGTSEHSGVSSREAKQIQDDLLNFLDDADPEQPVIEDLNSVIKSFEEEILVPDQAPPVMTSDSVLSRPELGYLLEASDDELGLPPSFSSGMEQKQAVDLKMSGSEPVHLDNIALGFDEGMPSYEPYNFGIAGVVDNNVNGSNEYITLGGGLFESYEPSDISEFAWHPESLSAL